MSNWEKWCKFSEQDHHIRDRILRIYLAVFDRLVLLNIGYIGGITGFVKITGISFSFFIPIGLLCSLISLGLSFGAAIPGVDALGRQREHNWAVYDNDNGKKTAEVEEIWTHSAKHESQAAKLLIGSVTFAFLALLFLFLEIVND